MNFQPIKSQNSAIKPLNAFVFGERNSGTNFTSELLKRNFPNLSSMAGDRIERFGFPYGWKHGFPTMVSAPPTTLCVVVFRNPEAWVSSMYNRPWHAHPSLTNLSFSKFIRARWMTRVDEQNFGVPRDDPRWLSDLQYDRHPLTGRVFSNIVELRNAKNDAFLNLSNRFDNFIAIQYEELNENPEDFVRYISNFFDIPTFQNFTCVSERRGKKSAGVFKPQTYEAISSADKTFLWSGLNTIQEQYLGYQTSELAQNLVKKVNYIAGRDDKTHTIAAAIYFVPEAYTTSGPQLMGRNAAGESFLNGFFQNSKANHFMVQVAEKEHANQFLKTAEALGRSEPIQVVDKTNTKMLKQSGVVFQPGPTFSKHAKERSFWGHNAWSLCGITHTTSSKRAMDSIRQILTTPVQTWDALICTSVAVKQNVQYLLNEEAQFLRERLGANKLVLPQMPVIPLGIQTKDFTYSNQQKSFARFDLDIEPKTIVVLFLGRLSFHAKAHPLPMYLALERASLNTGKKVVLIECGWYASESIEKSYHEAAAKACPSVKRITLDGRIVNKRKQAWAAADIFCSLTDNIQETFGITPIEAMATGLPVVVSDWDGYKDTVVHGVNGFRIPTTMPAAGQGKDLALRHALDIDTYDRFVGYACSVTAVDIEVATSAFISLFSNESLRHKMGSAGQKRSREVYDWSVIIPQYEDLWAELNELRQHSTNITQYDSKMTAYPDPFAAFSSYPTQTLKEETYLVTVEADLEALCVRVDSYRNLKVFQFAKVLMPSSNEVRVILANAAKGPKRAGDLVKNLSPERESHLLRSLGWLLKVGALKIVFQPSQIIDNN